MKLLTRQAITCAFIIACSSLSSFRSQTIEKKTSGSSVSGTVTMKGKGVPGITVVLTGNNPNGPQTATTYQAKTDQEGHYRIVGVPAGPYQVRPEAPAYVVGMKSGETTLMIDEGESIEDIDFTLTKGGVITGRVTTTERLPLIEQMVMLIPVVNPNTPEYLSGSGGRINVPTDDRGVYRIFSIPAGKYKVSVGQGRGSWFGGGGRQGPFRPTFYPGVEDMSKAAIVEVSEGSELTNIDITVDTNDTSEKFSASGRVVEGASGQAVPNVRLYVYMMSGGRSFTSPSVSDGDGQFKVEGLPPGQYVLYGEPQQSGERTASVQFEVTNANVNGLVVKTVKVASVSGQVVLEDGEKSLGRSLEFQVSVNVQKGTGSSGTSVSTQQGGMFKIDGLEEGTAKFQITLLRGGPVKQLAISRVERDGVVQPEGVALKNGEQVTGLRIYVNSNNGTIRGVVKFENGELPPGGRLSVWLSPTDSTRLLEGAMPGPYVDSRGHFIVEGLPAGTYELNAAAYMPNRRAATAKQQVTVADRTVSEVTITIDLSPGP